MSNTPAWKTSRIYGQLWLRAILFASPLLAAVFLPGEFADPDGTPWGLMLVFVFMVLCMWPLVFAAHWIEGGSDGLRLRYWPLLSRTVSYSDIASVEFRSNVSPWDFGGIGLRVASGGVLAFVNRKGPGVAIQTTTGRSYFIIVKDDAELAKVREQLSLTRGDLVSNDQSSGS